MSTVNGQPRLTVADLVTRCRGQFISLTNTFSYFCTPPMAEEDLRQYLHDPIAALSPLICGDLGTVGLALVPYLEKGNGRARGGWRDDDPGAGDQGRRHRQLSLRLLQRAGRTGGGYLAVRNPGRLLPAIARGTESGSAWRGGRAELASEAVSGAAPDQYP